MAAKKTQPARGMRDFLPEDVRKREYVIGVIKEVYERYGFEPLATPAVENIETLMGKYGEEGNQLIFKILKRGVHEGMGEADLALRYDLTVPLARVVAEYRDKLPKFFKRYQIQPVWRADRPARGRFREFYQCDVDVLGSKSMIVEAEICSAASEALINLGFSNFIIHLNHRALLTSMLNEFGINSNSQSSALIALDKLGKIGPDGVRKEFAKRNLPQEPCDFLLDLFARIEQYAVDVFDMGADDSHVPTESNIKDWNSFTVGELIKLVGHDPQGQRAIGELTSILELTSTGRAKGKVSLAPNLARGLSYYTGAIMEITMPGLSGSLGGGGRYDNLVGSFIGQETPACGFSLGLERIMVLMDELKMFPINVVASPADVMVTIWKTENASDKNQAAAVSLSFATALREAGLRVDVYPARNVKVGTQIAYASKRGLPFVVILGEGEVEKGLATLKNLITGDQQILERSHIPSVIKSHLSRNAKG
jgi:histidyl-tRNA synthetase